mmetsp:Transcript_41655/g.126299  ORF Transcript_41655/g.126299 Transcript_41655/m.126299 type:complete len:208 (+) Transcript_41655:805-1428(+)
MRRRMRRGEEPTWTTTRRGEAPLPIKETPSAATEQEEVKDKDRRRKSSTRTKSASSAPSPPPSPRRIPCPSSPSSPPRPPPSRTCTTTSNRPSNTAKRRGRRSSKPGPISSEPVSASARPSPATRPTARRWRWPRRPPGTPRWPNRAGGTACSRISVRMRNCTDTPVCPTRESWRRARDRTRTNWPGSIAVSRNGTGGGHSSGILID